MIVLGIHDGHNCGSALFKDGNLICALSEERVTRNKNEYGFPIHAINYCLKHANLKKTRLIKYLFQLRNFHLDIF